MDCTGSQVMAQTPIAMKSTGKDTREYLDSLDSLVTQCSKEGFKGSKTFEKRSTTRNLNFQSLTTPLDPGDPHGK